MKHRNMLRKVGSRVAVGSVAFVPAFAFAQSGGGVTFDPADTLAIVTSATTFITTVGLAVLGLIMVAKGIRWARRAG